MFTLNKDSLIILRESQETIMVYLTENKESKEVEELIIDNCSIENVSFLANFTKLVRITLKNNKSLTDIRDILLKSTILLAEFDENEELDEQLIDLVIKGIEGRHPINHLWVYLESFTTKYEYDDEYEEYPPLYFDYKGFLSKFPTVEDLITFLQPNNLSYFERYITEDKIRVIKHNFYKIFIDRLKEEIEESKYYNYKEILKEQKEELKLLNKCYNIITDYHYYV